MSNAKTKDGVTPMMEQYRRLRAQVPEDTVLFFRLGDFYEMFYDDARRVAPVLDIALTRRQGMPMCGVPYHAAENYMARLIRAGMKVAVCDQLEDPAQCKGIVRRDITRIVTPGTATEEGVLDSARHHFLAGLHQTREGFGLGVLDLSTGWFSVERHATAASAHDALRRLAPAECIVPVEQRQAGALADVLGVMPAFVVTPYEDWVFAPEAAHDLLVRHFRVHSLAGFGCENDPVVTGAAGAVLHYVKETLRRPVAHIRGLRVETHARHLLLDDATLSNLDLVGTRGREGAPCLLRVLDVTRTAMGARLLRDWLLRPAAELETIRARHDAVEALIADRARLHGLREVLGGVRDLERLIARLNTPAGNPRDAVALGQSLAAIPGLRATLGAAPGLLGEREAQLVPQPELVALVGRALADEPPVSLRDGGMIRPGYSAELDELRRLAGEGRQWLAEYQATEQARTGIKTLKVRHNKVFGYYIEVSKGQLEHVPADYIRRQTIATGERFVTPPLKEYESRIVGAHERAVALEQELFEQVRQTLAAATAPIQTAAAAVAELDVLAAFADRALVLRHVRPRMVAEDALVIREGRHPVVETMPGGDRFVPNDTRLDGKAHQIMILTGPNMAGKSTYIRQVALIVIMAHMGAFVPAAAATIALTDRVFTRVGASDDLARGRSTFMVEMQETANILNNATPRSLIVLDEIGRGTSTFDGISIAWAVAEHLHNTPAVKAKTLFATHYHELTDLALTLRGVRNYNVQVREHEGHVVFVRKIVPGGADKSYGIHVARLAGMPGDVIERANEILANLEEGEVNEAGQPKIARRRARRPRDDASQMSLFG